MRILAVDATNAAESQLAEGWLRALSTPDVEVYSAGATPTRLRPEAVAVMAEVGVDLALHRAKPLSEVPAPDVAIALAPVASPSQWSRAIEWVDWPGEELGEGSDLAAFRRVRDGLRVRAGAFLRQRGHRIELGRSVRDRFALRPDITFLNHGSFGAAPRVVLEAQRRLQDELEAQPVAFMRSLPARVRRVAALVASFLRADPQDVVFVDNATSGVTAVLRSFQWNPGDIVYVTSHGYGAVRAALEHLARRVGIRVVVGHVPFPVSGPDEVLAAVERTMPAQTRLAIFDHITSPTGLVFPIVKLVERCRDQGILVMVDGAHAPGHVPVDLEALDADFWVGNLHKWLFAPKGSAALHVRRAHHELVDPLVFSHLIGKGLSSAFDFQGTRDPSPWLAAEEALAFAEGLGIDRIRAANIGLRAEAAEVLCERVGVRPPAPLEMLGALQTLPLPFATDGTLAQAAALNAWLWDEHKVEAVFVPFEGQVWLRIACQIYNHVDEYELLADLLRHRL